MEGESFGMNPMNAQTGREIVSDRTGGRNAAIDQLQGDGGGMRKGVQLEANQDGGVQEAVRGTRVDQRLDGDWRLTGDEEVDQKGEVTRVGRREGGGKGKGAAQPGSYWLGWEFFEPAAATAAATSAAAAAAAAAGEVGRVVQGPGKGPWEEGKPPGGRKG